MKIRFLILSLFCCFSLSAQIADKKTYLKPVLLEMQKKWPNNRTINLIFHGHSVPSGYFTAGQVHTFEAYPYMTHVEINRMYPYAVVNVITTSIGGEQAETGEKRFQTDVLNKKPDVVFIDYALNDRGIGVERAREAWKKMIEAALSYGCKVILMTPTPDTREDILSDEAPLAAHAKQIRDLAAEYQVGLVDCYQAFKDMKTKGTDLSLYMAQNNHPNEEGHRVVAEKIKEWFTYVPSTDGSDIHFDFENNSETHTYDKITNREAKFNGSKIVNDDIRGKVLDLPTTQSNMKLETSPDFLSGNFTLLFWYNQPSNVFWRNMLYVAEASGKNFLGLTKENWHEVKQFCFYNNAVSGVVGSNLELVNNKWYHIALTVNNKVGTFYLDGVQKSSAKLDMSQLNLGDFYLGTPNNTTALCKLDDVMLFSQPLGAAEIQNIYNQQKNKETSILNPDIKNQVSVYPNPVKKYEPLFIDISDLGSMKGITLKAFDLEGNLLHEQQLLSPEYCLYIPEKSGFQLLVIGSNKNEKYIKIIVQ